MVHTPQRQGEHTLFSCDGWPLNPADMNTTSASALQHKHELKVLHAQMLTGHWFCWIVTGKACWWKLASKTVFHKARVCIYAALQLMLCCFGGFVKGFKYCSLTVVFYETLSTYTLWSLVIFVFKSSGAQIQCFLLRILDI